MAQYDSFTYYLQSNETFLKGSDSSKFDVSYTKPTWLSAHIDTAKGYGQYLHEIIPTPIIGGKYTESHGRYISNEPIDMNAIKIKTMRLVGYTGKIEYDENNEVIERNYQWIQDWRNKINKSKRDKLFKNGELIPLEEYIKNSNT